MHLTIGDRLISVTIGLCSHELLLALTQPGESPIFGKVLNGNDEKK